MFNKKALSGVVATFLLVITTVMSIVFFQNYMFNYASSLTVNAETQDTTILTTGIDSLVGNVLYFKNEYSDLSVLNVKAGNISCNVTEGFFSSGLEEIDLGICLNDLEEERIHIFTVISDKGVFEKSIFVDNIVFVPPCGGFFCTALSSSLSDETPSSGSDVVFYANYTSLDFPVSGIGLSRYEIGQVVWENSLSGSYYSLVTFFDADGDGDNEIGVAKNTIQVYEKNGSLLWSYINNSCYYSYNLNSFSSLDSDNDGIEELIASGTYKGPIVVENETTLFGLDITSSSQTTKSILGDFDGDSFVDDIVVTNGTHIVAYFYNETTWNLNWTSEGAFSYESLVLDINEDGYDDVFMLSYSFGLSGFYGNNGSLIWNKDVGNNQYSVDFGDFDHDGKKHEFILAEAGDLFWINSTGDAYQFSDVPMDNFILETRVLDVDVDGYEDDVVIVDNFVVDHLYIRAFNESADELWYYDYPVEGEKHIYSMWVDDINADNEEEIIFSTNEKNGIVVLNKDGELLWHYDNLLGSGTVANFVSGKTSEAIISGDVNNDSVIDLVVSSESALSVLQDVSCFANFDDGMSYNMTWNNSILKWQFNRSFVSSGNYEYNITCEKNLYETQIGSFNISVS